MLYEMLAAFCAGIIAAQAYPVLNQEHATSSQSIIFHHTPRRQYNSLPTIGPIDSSGHHNEPKAHPKYEFKYEVSDRHTGDQKSHWETRVGDKVTGMYTLVEPDGTIRKVEYTADDQNGFNAVVTRTGRAKHPPPLALQPKPSIPSSTFTSGATSSIGSGSGGLPRSGSYGSEIGTSEIGSHGSASNRDVDIAGFRSKTSGFLSDHGRSRFKSGYVGRGDFHSRHHVSGDFGGDTIAF